MSVARFFRPGAPGSSTREDKGFVSCPVAACGVQVGGTVMPGKEIVTLLLMILFVVLLFSLALAVAAA